MRVDMYKDIAGDEKVKVCHDALQLMVYIVLRSRITHTLLLSVMLYSCRVVRAHNFFVFAFNSPPQHDYCDENSQTSNNTQGYSSDTYG